MADMYLSNSALYTGKPDYLYIWDQLLGWNACKSAWNESVNKNPYKREQ